MGKTSLTLLTLFAFTLSVFGQASNVKIKSSGELTEPAASVFRTANSIPGLTTANIFSAHNTFPFDVATADPDQISVAPSAWFKADAITGLANGAAVTSWLDSSGNSKTATQATANQKPLYVTGALNSLPVVRFDGFNDLLTTPTLFNSGYNTAFTAVVVYRLQAPDTNLNVILASADVNFYLTRSKQTIPVLVNGAITNIASDDSIAWSVETVRYDGLVKAVRVDGRLVYSAASVGTLNASGALAIGATASTTFPADADIAEIVIYNSAVSDRELKLVETGLARKYNLARKAITIIGDSIASAIATASDSWPAKLTRSLGITNWRTANYAYSGEQALTATQVARAIPDIKTGDVLFYALGSNDVAAGTVAATLEAQIQSDCQRLQAAGANVIVCTILPRTTGGFDAARNTINTWIRANYLTFSSGLCDFALEPTMGPDGAASNATYYADGIHPTDAGWVLMEVVAEAAVKAARFSTVTATSFVGDGSALTGLSGGALTNTYVGYGAGGVLSGEAAFTYNAATDTLTAGTFSGSGAGLTGIPSQVSDTAFAGSWNGVTTIAPSKNAVYDQLSLMPTLAADQTFSGVNDFSAQPTINGSAILKSGGALGTPTSGTLTNVTGLPISTGVSGLGTGIAAWLADPTSAKLKTAVTDETGSGALVFATAPTFEGITINDGVGKTTLVVSEQTASAVNYFSLINAATGNAPAIQAAGTDTNIGLNLLSKGSGTVRANSVDVATTSGTQTLTNKSIAASQLTGTVGGGTLAGSFTTLAASGARTFAASDISTTALATPSALTATQYTAFASTVSGAAHMGYGTTNDVSLMNRAGTVCLGVGPNTTTINTIGSLTVNNTAVSTYAGSNFGLTIQGNGTYAVLALKNAQPLMKWIGNYNAGDGAEMYQSAAGLFSFNVNGSTTGFNVSTAGDLSALHAFSVTGASTLTGGVTIGSSGTAILKHLSASATLDFASTAAGAVTDLTITVTGAALSDTVAIGVPNGSVPATGTFQAWVSAANTVTVRYQNNDLITARDPASGTFRADVWQH